VAQGVGVGLARTGSRKGLKKGAGWQYRAVCPGSWIVARSRGPRGTLNGLEGLRRPIGPGNYRWLSVQPSPSNETLIGGGLWSSNNEDQNSFAIMISNDPLKGFFEGTL
jgi:hypothetical protein